MIRRIEVEFHPSQTSAVLVPSCYETPPRSHNSDLLLLDLTTLVGKIEIVRHTRQARENAGMSEKGNTETRPLHCPFNHHQLQLMKASDAKVDGNVQLDNRARNAILPCRKYTHTWMAMLPGPNAKFQSCPTLIVWGTKLLWGSLADVHVDNNHRSLTSWGLV